MPRNFQWQSDFTETLAMQVALRSALQQELFGDDPRVRKAAQELLQSLESDRTTFGRQLKMLRLMRRGVDVDELARKLGCSRRTVFRYMNHLEETGVSIVLEESRYSVSGRLSGFLGD